MEQLHKQVILLGSGAAGLAAACALHRAGITDLLVLERDSRPGGLLNQCIHEGFGLFRYGAELTGPEYAQRLLDEARDLGIPIRTGCTAVALNAQKQLTVSCREGGLLLCTAEAVVVTVGCRERPAGALLLAGTRPRGVYTAGQVQSYVNLKGILPGREAVILGSGDVGLIMARRLTLEGVRVRAVVEQRRRPGGLPRNVAQCLEDFSVPLLLGCTVTRLNGDPTLESVTVSRVDEALVPIPGTEEEIPCDCLILSAGLIPDCELLLQAGAALDPETAGPVTDRFCQTTVPGIFAAGNGLHIHPLADEASREAEQLAGGVGRYLAGKLPPCVGPQDPLHFAPAHDTIEKKEAAP